MRRALSRTRLVLVLTLPLVISCGSGGGDSQTQPPPSSRADSGKKRDAGAGAIDAAVDEVDPPPSGDALAPEGRVVLLNLYHPETRCYDPATPIGYYDELPDGAPAPCATGERCYVRTDGLVAYAPKTCIKPGRFLANYTDLPYSDLGPCEPAKHEDLRIKSCPNPTCGAEGAWARDVVMDVARGCATSIVTRGCREDAGPPTECWCDPSAADRVYVPANAKAPRPPAGFERCASSGAACKKALASVDSASGCAAATPSVDAGSSGDVGFDAAPDVRSESVDDAPDAG